MNIGLVALIVLFIVIVLGFWKKMNVGLLAISATVILGFIADISAKEIIKGFSGSMFMTLLGIMFLFSVVQKSGALENLMKRVVGKLGRFVWFIPILMYLTGYVISAVGPGCVPALVLVAAISIPIAKQTGYNPIMLMLIGDSATYAGRFTAITPEGVLVSQLMGDQGITGVLMPLVINATVVTIVLSIIFYVAYKGYKVKTDTNKIVLTKAEPFTLKQYFALGGIVALVVGILVLNINVGLAGFLIASVLLLFNVVTEKEALAGIGWNTIILVCGVGVLMNVVISTGGITILANALSSIMVPFTAASITGLTAGIMSWFSSTLGVVLPTLLPTIGTIVENVGGVSAVEILSVVAITSSFAGFSPASTVGAIIMSSCASDEKYKEMDQSKMFMELFLWSVFCVIFITVIALTGVFGIIA